MSKAQLLKLARSAIEDLPPDLQEAAIMRSTGSLVVVWDLATCDMLAKLYSSARAVALIEGLA